jgi:CBS-domain-containing membrane protein
VPPLPYPRIAIRAAGGAGGIALMQVVADAAGQPLMLVPFATSIVMVMGSPEVSPARPRCVVAGHVLSAIAGIACVTLLGDALWVSALGVGLAIVLMHAFDAFHPPAGISPIIITTAHATPLFILSPVAAGALILVAYAFAFHRLTGEKWPERWV